MCQPQLTLRHKELQTVDVEVGIHHVGHIEQVLRADIMPLVTRKWCATGIKNEANWQGALLVRRWACSNEHYRQILQIGITWSRLA